MSMKFLADNGGLQALIQAIKDQLALFDRNKQNKLVAGRGITINQSTRVISSDGEPNVQADWNMATESSASFIRNKPDIYTKREIDSMFSATITFVRVDELPATGTHGTVYLVPKQGAGTGDIYDEYLWLSASGSVEAHYELIGSTSVDLTNYYTKSQTDNLLGDKVDKESGKGLSTNDYTTAEKNKLGGIESGAEVNVQSDWNQSDNTKDDYIKNKPTLRQPSADGTSEQYLKSNGSGNAPSWETMDSSPTANSTKAVTSGGVKTALDGKQASVTITTNANTPTDNDTVIMQSSGTTNTTTFVRRTLSVFMQYVRNYFYERINLPYDSFYSNNRRFDSHVHGLLWGANERFNVDWKTYDSVTHEVVYEATNAMKAQLFNENAENYSIHPVEGEYDVITISPAGGQSKIIIGSYGTGKLLLVFYNTSYPSVAPTVRIYGGRSGSKTWTTLAEPTKPANSVFQYSLSQEPAIFLEKIEITIQGRTIGTGNERGAHLANIDYIGLRSGISEMAAVTKYAVSQQLYGELTAPKLIKRGGTNQQVLLANGDTASLPLAIANGGTGQTTAQSACNAFINALSTGTATPTDSDYYVCQFAGGGTSTTTYHRRPMSSLWSWIKTHFDTAPTANSDNPVTSGGIKTALDGYFPLAGKKAIAGVYKNAPSYIHNVDFGNTSTEGIWRKFCVISTRQTYRNAVGEIHINARSTQGTIYLTIGSSGTFPQEGENNTLSPSVKYLSLYNDYRPVYWRVNDDNELELWWKATQYYDSFGVTGVNFSPYFLSLDSAYNAGVNVQWTNVVSLEAPANLSQAQDVSLTTLDVSAGDVLTIDGDNYKDYLRTPSGGIPTSVLEADRIVLPRAYSTIFFNTTNTAKISYIRGASNSNVQKNGRRLTIAGNWKPREESSGDGRFTQYLYKYRSGSVGASQFADCLREAYEDFVYFNGIWYSKGY